MKNFWESLPRPIIALAPMDGVTDVTTRCIHRRFGADLTMTEFVSADGLAYNPSSVEGRVIFDPAEMPVCIQFFGKEPENFRKAAHYAENEGFAGVDINFGCPSKRVVRNGCGVALMADIDRCQRIIENVVSNTGLPVSIKVRSGYKGETTIAWLEKLKIVDLGVRALTVHGRTYEQLFSGELDRETVKALVDLHSEIPVIANGGIDSVAGAVDVLEQTKAAGVMVGQGSYGNPWLFQKIAMWRETGTVVEPDPSFSEKLGLLEEHVCKSISQRGERVGLIEVRKHMGWYLKGVSGHLFPGLREMRVELMRADSSAAAIEIIKSIRSCYL